MNNDLIHWEDEIENNQKHHFLVPSPSCRALIIGESGCGKTSLLFKMLLNPMWLDYKNLFVFGKSLHQSDYKLLKSGFDKGYNKKEILELFKKGGGNIDSFIKNLPKKGKLKCKVYYFEDSESIPDPQDVDKKEKNLFIFDDIMTDKNQSKAEDFYTRGRHNNTSSIYISQNYFKLPRQTIRANVNVLILFSLPKRDLNHIYSEFISNDMEWVEFLNFSDSVWKEQHSYIIINKDLSPSEGKYQANFNRIYIPKKYIFSS